MNNAWGSQWPTTQQSQAWAKQEEKLAAAEAAAETVQQPEQIIPVEIADELRANNMPVNNDGVLLLWQQSQAALAAAKAKEMELRKIAVNVYVPNPQEGMNNVDLGQGYTLKAGIKFNYKLADNDTVEKCLDRIAKIGNEGAFIADRLVSWTPNFLLSEYRTLQDEVEKENATAIQIMAIVNEMLTIDKGAPTLEIKEPKGKKK